MRRWPLAMYRRRVTVVLALVAAAASRGTTPAPRAAPAAPTAAPTWFGDVKPIVDGRSPADAIPGVPEEVHHIIVLLAAPSDAATVDGWDAAEAPPTRCASA